MQGGGGVRGTGEVPFLSSASMEKSLLRAEGNVCRECFSDCPRKHSAWQQRAFQNAAPRGGRSLQAENREGLEWVLHLVAQKRQPQQRIEFQLWVQLEGLRGLCWGMGVRADADEEVFRQMLQCASVIANLCFNMMA